jgi:hypothetical protein
MAPPLLIYANAVAVISLPLDTSVLLGFWQKDTRATLNTTKLTKNSRKGFSGGKIL